MSSGTSGSGLRDAAVVLGVFVLAGVLVGALWSQLVDPVVLTRNELGVGSGEVALSQSFDADGWFTVLGSVAGVLLGLVLMAWRDTDEVVTLLLIVAGALAASWLAGQVGTILGPDDPATVLRGAEQGATAPAQVRVTADVVHLVWPIASLIGALLVLWSPPGQRLVGGPRPPRNEAGVVVQ